MKTPIVLKIENKKNTSHIVRNIKWNEYCKRNVFIIILVNKEI